MCTWKILSWLEHYNGIAEVMGSNPRTFFRFTYETIAERLSSKCEDHFFNTNSFLHHTSPTLISVTKKVLKLEIIFYTKHPRKQCTKKTYHLRCSFSLLVYSFKDGWRSRIKRVSFTPQPLFRVLFIPPFEILATGRFGHRPTPCTMFPCVSVTPWRKKDS